MISIFLPAFSAMRLGQLVKISLNNKNILSSHKKSLFKFLSKKTLPIQWLRWVNINYFPGPRSLHPIKSVA